MSDLPQHTPDAQSADPGSTESPPSIIPTATPIPLPGPSAVTPMDASPETEAIIEMIRRCLGPTADDAARAMTREICARIAQLPTASPPVVAPAHTAAAAYFGPGAVPTVAESPITAATRALRQLPPEQLLDMVLQRLRAALPAGVTVPPPKGIQFQLLAVAPPTGDTR